ncbi:hypothetical protein XELAEV_18032246mg [Xenopus laevis]|uniref:Uncharacterized protein n=1 Tax=Xenopus laevis TaxID=8355 RepID=A0A974HGJ5_XENLA|nr:hypothetical protein XELAEV_18032246mg [Xenopus laevis]
MGYYLRPEIDAWNLLNKSNNCFQYRHSRIISAPACPSWQISGKGPLITWLNDSSCKKISQRENTFPDSEKYAEDEMANTRSPNYFMCYGTCWGLIIFSCPKV